MRRALVVAAARVAMGLGVGLALSLGTSGCASPHEYTITIKDPRAVRLSGVPTPARVEDGAPVVGAGPNDSTPWSLVMFREPEGGLRLRCAACSRDAYLVAADGVMHVVAEESPDVLGLIRPSPKEVDRGAEVMLPYHYCGFPSKHGCRAAVWDGVRVTPWSNVMEVRARNAPRAMGSPLILGGAGVTGIIGTGLLVVGLRSDSPAGAVLGTAAGVGVLALTAAVVRMFVDANIERRIDPPEGGTAR